MLRKDFAVTIVRMILNNKLWCTFLMLFNFELIVASKTQKNQITPFLKKATPVHIIPNSICDLKPQQNKATDSNNIIFGYIGHTYPIKGLDFLASAFQDLKN